MEKPKTNILIADDHSIVAGGIAAILNTADHLNVIGIVDNGQKVLERAAETSIDLVLLDINMPVMNGIECTKQLKAQYPAIKVIIITMYNRKQFIRELFEVGADGCILKSNSGKELLTAIERVISGKTYFDQLNDFIDAPKEFKEFRLSEREIEIIELIAEGFTSKEIATRLFISEHTVKTHRKNIFQKTNVNDSDELIKWAMNNKLIR
ncbi:response regulator transcription factor [Fluviicola taffensis]|uniref:response regulator transcription factor n=1 Tax=Fluviicola taffensis TaxID=191579 RepID=UPI0031382761